MQSRQTLATAIVACTLSLATIATAEAAVVYANNPTPGDSFTNAGTGNQGQAVGATGWYYNNVRNSGVVGINSTLPRSGNGSAYFSSPSGAAKADIEFLPSAVNIGGNFYSGASLGLFSQLSSFGYDWYRVGTSTNPAVQHPALRVLLDLDGNPLTPGDRAGLVFERAYNSLPTLTDQWLTDVIGASTNLWSFGALGFATGGYNVTLAQWQADTALARAVVVGFSAGVGSGWNGAFTGAVDNIGWTIGQNSVSYNFEVERQGTVPEPGTIALLGLALAGLATTRRRHG